MTIKTTADRQAVVDTSLVWIDAKEVPPPRGSKLLCINRKQGIALLSDWRDDFGFTHWHPLPRFTSSHL